MSRAKINKIHDPAMWWCMDQDYPAMPARKQWLSGGYLHGAPFCAAWLLVTPIQ
jgi:hypothetical protein